MEIKRHAGHERFSTTEIYLRDTGTLREGFGNVFPELAASLLTPESSRRPRVLSSTVGDDFGNESGAEGNRTLYLLHAMQALSQMSYSP
jgi:hypothetical protein